MTMNTFTGIISMLLGVGYTYLSWALPRATIGHPLAPSVYPLLLGIGLTIMGVILLIQEGYKTKPSGNNSISLTFSKYGKSIASVVALCVLYAFTFERLGYLLATFLFLLSVLLLFNGKTRLLSCLGISLGFSVAVYILFGEIFNIQLPRMPILGL